MAPFLVLVLLPLSTLCIFISSVRLDHFTMPSLNLQCKCFKVFPPSGNLHTSLTLALNDMVQCVFDINYAHTHQLHLICIFVFSHPLSPFASPLKLILRCCLLPGEKRVPRDGEDVNLPGGLRHLRLQDEGGVHQDQQHLGEGGNNNNKNKNNNNNSNNDNNNNNNKKKKKTTTTCRWRWRWRRTS